MSSSANAQKAKQSSRWGSLFSGAVAGLESRLDTILAEDGASAAQKRSDLVKGEAVKADQIVQNTVSLANQSSKTTATPPAPAAHPSTELYELPKEASKLAQPPDDPPGPPLAGGASLSAPNANQETVLRCTEPESETNAPEKTATDVQVEEQSAELDLPIGSNAAGESSKAIEELQGHLRQARIDYERVELRRQEEAHENLERIDALQAKLRYLAREASAAARQAAQDAGEEGLRKRIADQDDKIAQLMEEGIKLSKADVSQSGTLRSLRAKAAEDANATVELHRKVNRMERQLGDATFNVSRLERERAQAIAKATRLNRIERETNILREEVAAKDQAIQRLETEARASSTQASEHRVKANEQALTEERKVVQSLREDLENAKIEQGIRDDRAKGDVAHLKEQQQREIERHRNAELGLRNEVISLESRLEAMRERTEEASAGSTGDAQAKLMRQIEILQSQYAVATENWQGIESSLQSRITALERERDDSARHETEARKRARESGISARRLQDQLDDASVKVRVLAQELEEHKSRADRLEKRAKEYERSLDEAQASFEKEKQLWESTTEARLEDERAKAQRHPAPINTAPSIADVTMALTSPNASMPRDMSNSDIASSRWLSSSRAPELSPGLRSPQHFSRRSSTIPPQRSLSELIPAYDETSSTTAAKDSPATPTLRSPEAEIDAFESSFSPGRNIHDVVSTSTAAAGPSVQLVERMSASVRRLESEKAASREELSRLQSQRDEARKEIVNLMTEVEAKREVDRQAAKLHGDLDKLNAQFERMAEMFGEKTERCEELEADVADLKKIYRELVERTVKT